ncbi:MAG: class I adenylate-forming enzyme family protein [Pseudomonadota bacterium]
MSSEPTLSETAPLIAYVAHWAEHTPKALALELPDSEISYLALWETIEGRARTLAQTTRPGDRVAAVLSNGLDYISLLYACYLTDRIFVGLDADIQRLAAVAALGHSEPTLVVCRDDWQSIDATLSRLESPPRVALASEFAAASDNGPELVQHATTAVTDSRRPAKLVFTSGTTGDPKAVTLSHENLACNARAIADYLRLGTNDRGLCVLPFTYAYGNSVLDSHLVAGATLVLGQGSGFPEAIAQQLSQSQATGFAAVTPLLHRLVASGALMRHETPALRYVTQAGSPMHPDAVKSLQRALGKRVEVFAMYGQTEATSRLTYLPPERLRTKPSSVGKPIKGTEIQIRTNDGTLAPPHQIGEIFARGPSIMMGYWRNDDATAAVLAPDGWLKTGDLGYLDRDGDLFITGRTREMILSGGYRIAPSEVEEVALPAAPQEQLAAVGVPDPHLGERLVLAVHWSQGRDPANQRALHQSVLSACRRGLPVHKRPKELVFVSDWPLTPSGKLRRHDLARQLAGAG